MKYVFCKDILPVCGMPFHSFNNVFHKAEVFSVLKYYGINLLFSKRSVYQAYIQNWMLACGLMLSTSITNNKTVRLFHLMLCPTSKSYPKTDWLFSVVHYKVELGDWLWIWKFSELSQVVPRTCDILFCRDKYRSRPSYSASRLLLTAVFPLTWLVSSWNLEAQCSVWGVRAALVAACGSQGVSVKLWSHPGAYVK